MSKGADKNKLILVIVLFILAALVLAWNMNWLSFGGSGGRGATTPTPSDGAPRNAGAESPAESQPSSHRTAPPK